MSLLIATVAATWMWATPHAPPAAEQERRLRQVELTGVDGEPNRLLILVNDQRLNPEKISPKGEWRFPWVVSGLGRAPRTGEFQIRFRVFSQERPERNDPAPAVTRMLLRLWDYNLSRLRVDHSPQFADQMVDVFLANEGQPGGEHLFDEDPFELDAARRPRRVNTIYIYHLPTFADPLQMARELAHEYGHASLPPIGGYRDPEYWANGELGERLYLTWLSRDLAAGRLARADAMGVTPDLIAPFFEARVKPLVRAAALNGPDPALLKRRDRTGLDAYLGLVLWAEQMLPERAFGRSLLLVGSQNAEDVPRAIVEAAGEVASWNVKVPEWLKNQPIWIPLGQGKLGGAAGLKRRGDWVQIRPGPRPVIVANPEPR